MANIIFTNYCNLNCQYCFAGKIKQENPQNITEQQLTTILNWLGSTPSFILNKIGIIGGEPTLHPQFINRIEQLTDFLEQKQISAQLFTNGLTISSYLNCLNDKYTLLININEEKINLLEEQLNYLFKNKSNIKDIIFGCNLYPEKTNYTFFWQLVKQYNIKKVRVSVTSPQNKYYIQNKELYFQQMIPIYERFILNSHLNECILINDCSWIPSCYLTNSFIIDYNKVDKICMPAVDITPDFKAIPCFGISEFVDCSNFKNYIELYNYFMFNKIVPYTKNNYLDKCKNCEKRIYTKCSGGCLNFRKKGEK